MRLEGRVGIPGAAVTTPFTDCIMGVIVPWTTTPRDVFTWPAAVTSPATSVSP